MYAIRPGRSFEDAITVLDRHYQPVVQVSFPPRAAVVDNQERLARNTDARRMWVTEAASRSATTRQTHAIAVRAAEKPPAVDGASRRRTPHASGGPD